jgi:hypothetical protein
MADDRDTIRQDDRLQADPELREGRSGLGRILMTLVGAAFIIGMVIFGVAQHRAGDTSAVSTQDTAAPPATAQSTRPTTTNPADQPPSTARGPSQNEQAQQGTSGRGSSDPGTNTGQAPAGQTTAAPSAR